MAQVSDIHAILRKLDFMTYRDRRGKTLADYPRPSVAVDTAVLTVEDGRLSVLLTRTNDDSQWRLPGTFVHEGETLADAVLRSLREKAGLEGLSPRQLHVFDAPDRDDRGWVISVAHLDVVSADRVPLTDRTKLVSADDPGPLVYDHALIVAAAVRALRSDYERMPDPAGLVPQPFIMRELRAVHEAVAGTALPPDTFRRSMLPGLVATAELARGGRGKPAELFRRA